MSFQSFVAVHERLVLLVFVAAVSSNIPTDSSVLSLSVVLNQVGHVARMRERRGAQGFGEET